MIKISGMRWATDNGGVACGPVGGSVYVEVEVQKDSQKQYVTLSQFCEFQKCTISDEPVMDKIIEAICSREVDFSKEYDKIEALYLDDEEREITEWFTYFAGSEYENAIKIACMAMNECYYLSEYTDEDAAKFIEKYCGKDIRKFKLPEVMEVCDEEF